MFGGGSIKSLGASLLAAALLASGWVATAVAASPFPPFPVPSPGALAVGSSNGYRVSVFPLPRAGKHGDEVVVSAVGQEGIFAVQAPANLAGEGIRARLGSFGRIALDWRPNGQVDYATQSCGDFRARFAFVEGSYVGSLRPKKTTR